MSPERRPVGRPRDADKDAKVLEAARDLLVTEGFEATTLQAIAQRSGVHASAIYRRWPSRIEIIEQVVFPGLAVASAIPSGDLRRDLRRFIRAYATTLGSPAARAAIPGLLASYQRAGRGDGREWLAVSARPQFVAIVQAAPEGTVDPDLDIDDVFDMLLGALVARALIPTVIGRDRPIERLVELTEHLLRPAGPVAAPAERA